LNIPFKIIEFRGDYRWLSNFSPCKIILDGLEYKSVEHAYVSAKSDDPEWKITCQTEESAGKLKRLGQKLPIKENWDALKISIMKQCLDQKFDQEPYKSNLISTGNVDIEEGNNWNDTFWGIDLKTGIGKNMLGKMIMEIRDRLSNINIF
jgi:ribA/ribD-fused uncharacterized protein